MTLGATRSVLALVVSLLVLLLAASMYIAIVVWRSNMPMITSYTSADCQRTNPGFNTNEQKTD
jgi:hypothetical protein